jgi:hypothetical protein
MKYGADGVSMGRETVIQDVINSGRRKDKNMFFVMVDLDEDGKI